MLCAACLPRTRVGGPARLFRGSRGLAGGKGAPPFHGPRFVGGLAPPSWAIPPFDVAIQGEASPASFHTFPDKPPKAVQSRDPGADTATPGDAQASVRLLRIPARRASRSFGKMG